VAVAVLHLSPPDDVWRTHRPGRLRLSFIAHSTQIAWKLALCVYEAMFSRKLYCITNLTYVKLPTPMYILIWTAICTLPACTSRTEGDRAMGTADVVWYRSPVDGSQQAYGIYVPANPPPPEGYPAVFHAHGYGWSVSSNFSQWQRDWADAHRWVLINLNARGPQFYECIGEVATLEVVRDATSRFGLDGRRLYITGASMGGTGHFVTVCAILRCSRLRPEWMAGPISALAL
jgi:hypothetical protein